MSAPPRFLVFRHLVLVLSFSSPTAQKQYVPVDPVDPSVRQRTIALLNRGDARGALRLLQASMKRPANTLDDGMTPSLWHYAGLANHMIDDLESAEVAYSKAVQFDRRDVQSWMNLGECALYQWKGDVALAALFEAVRVRGGRERAPSAALAKLHRALVWTAHWGPPTGELRYELRRRGDAFFANVSSSSSGGGSSSSSSGSSRASRIHHNSTATMTTTTTTTTNKKKSGSDYTYDNGSPMSDPSPSPTPEPLPFVDMPTADFGDLPTRRLGELAPLNKYADAAVPSGEGEKRPLAHVRRLQERRRLEAAQGRVDSSTAAAASGGATADAAAAAAPGGANYGTASAAGSVGLAGKRPLHVGFLSSDFGVHPVSSLVRGMLEMLDGAAFSGPPPPPPITTTAAAAKEEGGEEARTEKSSSHWGWGGKNKQKKDEASAGGSSSGSTNSGGGGDGGGGVRNGELAVTLGNPARRAVDVSCWMLSNEDSWWRRNLTGILGGRRVSE